MMRGLNKAESDALRVVALSHGYTVTRGPTAKNGARAGNPIELIQAVICGEVTTILLDTEERWALIEWLEQQAPGAGRLEETLRVLAGQLRSAAEREQALEDEDIEVAIEERRSAH